MGASHAPLLADRLQRELLNLWMKLGSFVFKENADSGLDSNSNVKGRRWKRMERRKILEMGKILEYLNLKWKRLALARKLSVHGCCSWCAAALLISSHLIIQITFWALLCLFSTSTPTSRYRNGPILRALLHTSIPTFPNGAHLDF